MATANPFFLRNVIPETFLCLHQKSLSTIILGHIQLFDEALVIGTHVWLPESCVGMAGPPSHD